MTGIQTFIEEVGPNGSKKESYVPLQKTHLFTVAKFQRHSGSLFPYRYPAVGGDYRYAQLILAYPTGRHF